MPASARLGRFAPRRPRGAERAELLDGVRGPAARAAMAHADLHARAGQHLVDPATGTGGAGQKRREERQDHRAIIARPMRVRRAGWLAAGAVVSLRRLRVLACALVAFLVALAPSASIASARIDALKVASDLDRSAEHSIELHAHGGHAVALPSGASTEIPTAPGHGLPRWHPALTHLRGDVSARPPVELAPPPSLRARVGVSVPRRCPPRLEDDDGP